MEAERMRNFRRAVVFIQPMASLFNKRDWNRAAASHFLARTGFGGSPQEIEAATAAGFETMVERTLRLPSSSEIPSKPEQIEETNPLQELRQLKQIPDEAERQKLLRQLRMRQTQQTLALVAWWLEQMRGANHPLLEKMTLFWHGHFATSMQKVRNPYAMWVQNDTLRKHALGSFGAMVKGISRDPAMIFWLDLQQNKKDHPNENFARELMELFTLGEGNYSEEDIMEAARAFTGYKARPDGGGFHLAARQHDGGEKVFFGKRGKWDGDDIIDIILTRPQCAKFIAAKVWEYFAYEGPEPVLVERLAAEFRRTNYDIRSLLLTVFTASEFFSKKAMRSQIKSPIQWTVQTAKQLEIGLPPPAALSGALRQMGQVPFAPPSVKGWDGGKAWISTSTLLFRYNFGSYMLGGDYVPSSDGKFAKRVQRAGNRTDFAGPDLGKIAPEALRKDPLELVQALCRRMFEVEVPAKEQELFLDYAIDRYPNMTDDDVRGLLHLMVSTPFFQVT